MGGAAVLAAKQYIPSVKAVATIGAPYQPEHVTRLFQTQKEEIENKGQAIVSVGGRPFTIKKQFLEDIKNLSNLHLINTLGAALMVLHAPDDATVGIENASQIFKAAQHPRSFISLDGADHLMTRKEDSLFAGDIIASWAVRYTDIPEDESLDTTYQAVVRTEKASFTTEIKAGRHHFLADEPVEYGGNDFGPTPYDLLVAALGACTSMTLRMYANQKSWDLQEVKVHLQPDKVYAEDCEQCETKKGKIDQIQRFIELEGELTQEQKQRLLEIADKCPVHRTLHAEIDVITNLMKSSD